MAIGGDRPPRLGGDVVTFVDMREFLVAYSEYEKQMHITNQNGGHRALARRRELVDSATQTLVAEKIYDGKPWVDLSEEELMQGLNRFAGVDMQQTSDKDFCRQIFRVLKMDASVPVDSRVDPVAPVAPVAYEVILQPGIGQFLEFEPRRVHTRINPWGLFLVHKLTCGKRESVSYQHSMKNLRAVGLLNPMRDRN